MTALLVPISDLKSYTRLLKKQNPSIKLKQTVVLNALCKLLGWPDYNNYKRHINEACNLRAAVEHPVIPISQVPLHELEKLALIFAARLQDDLTAHYNSKIDLPPSWVIGQRHLLSTLFDQSIRYQVANIVQLPALRISGVLYLVSFFSGLPIFDTAKWHVNWPTLVEYLMKNDLPEDLNARLTHYAYLNAKHGHAYHEGIFEKAKESLLSGSLNESDFVDLIQGVLTHEQSYLSSFQPRQSTQRQPKFTFPVVQDTSEHTQTLSLISNIRKLTSATEPLLLGTPRLIQRTVESNGIISEKKSPKWLDFRRALRINHQTLKKNLLLIGATGSGRSYATYFLLHQTFMNNTGAIIIDAKAGNDCHWSIQSVAKVHGKEDNVSLLTTNHHNELMRLNLTDSMRKKRIKNILLCGLENSRSEVITHILKIFDQLIFTAPKIGEPVLKGKFPYLIILNDVMPYFTTEDDLTVLRRFLDCMKQRNVSVILSTDNLYSPSKNLLTILNNHIGGYLMMQHEINENIPIDLDVETVRDIQNQIEGEFRYATSENGIDVTPYQFPYPAPERLNCCYLVLE